MSPSYVIVSPRVGEPGAPYTPPPGVNVEALIENGFIREIEPGAVSPPKPARKRTIPTETKGT